MFKVRSISLDFGRVSKEPIDFLLENGCEFETVQVSDPSEEKMREAIRDVDALVVGLQCISEKVLGFPNRLKVIGRHGVGLDNIDLQAAGRRGIPVVYAPGANAHSVADLVIGLILALARKIPYADRTTKNVEWKRVVGNEIWGKTLGIFGLGQIGFKVAQRAKGFDMNVIGYDVVKNESLAKECGVAYRTKEEILSGADFITLHLPYAKETIGFISEYELKAMKKTSSLINTSRGGIVDEKALFHALKEGWIAGAALDVFEKEPPDRSPLFELDNFVASPHMGGITMEGISRTGMTVARDIVAVLNGQPCEFLANKEFLQ
jgi:D-3-phosphoglycerate dehydrogenase